MMNKHRLLGVLVIILVLGFLMTGCELEPKEDVWVKGTLSNYSDVAFHEFDVVSGKKYYVWVREYWSNSVVVADGFADVVISAKYKNGDVIFAETNAGANKNTDATNTWGASNFTASKNGVVEIKVSVDQDLFSGGPGKYWVAMTTSNKRPSEK